MAGCDCACHGTEETAEHSAHGDAVPSTVTAAFDDVVESMNTVHDDPHRVPMQLLAIIEPNNGGKMASSNFAAAADDSWYEPYTNMGAPGGSAMTAPAGNAEAGTTIGALERAYQAELASAISYMDQATATAEDRKQAAANFDNVVGQLSSARHDSATINEAAAVSEALRATAQQCEQTKASYDSGVATLNTALEGIKRHQLAREYAGSVQSGASVDAFRE